jgi:hypothetical protein
MSPERFASLVLYAMFVGAAACGGATSTGGDAAAGTTGAAGAAGTTGGAGTGGAAGAGQDECATDSDCPPIQCLVQPCPESICTPGRDGSRSCVSRAHPALETCPADVTQPCCASDAACTERPHGMCVPFSVGYCGGPAPPRINQCRYDDCQGDADCSAMPNGICVNGYPRSCVYGPCRRNADCTKGAGGTCAVAAVGGFCPHTAVYCHYASDPCRSDGDCKGGTSPFGQVCVPKADLQGTRCMDQPPPPP